MDEFRELMKLTKWQADHYTRIEILDSSKANLNAISLGKRFSDHDNQIICIGRTFGAGAHEVGFALANELNLKYYDKKIFMELMKRMEAGSKSIWEHDGFYARAKEGDHVYKGGVPFEDDKLPPLVQFKEDFFHFHGLPRRDALYFTQSKMILDLAQSESFVMMGRYADVVLTNENIPHISIFITAPFEKRVERIKAMYPDSSEKQIKKALAQSDRTHMRDYRFFTGKEWGRSENYDLTINSASYGIPGTVAVILDMLEGRSGYK